MEVTLIQSYEGLLTMFRYDEPADFLNCYFNLTSKKRREFREYLLNWCRQNDQIATLYEFFDLLLKVYKDV